MYIYIYTSQHSHTNTYVHVYENTYMYIYVCIYIYISIYAYTTANTRQCMRSLAVKRFLFSPTKNSFGRSRLSSERIFYWLLYMHISIYIYMHTYIYTCIFIYMYRLESRLSIFPSRSHRYASTPLPHDILMSLCFQRAVVFIKPCVCVCVPMVFIKATARARQDAEVGRASGRAPAARGWP